MKRWIKDELARLESEGSTLAEMIARSKMPPDDEKLWMDYMAHRALSVEALEDWLIEHAKLDQEPSLKAWLEERKRLKQAWVEWKEAGGMSQGLSITTFYRRQK